MVFWFVGKEPCLFVEISCFDQRVTVGKEPCLFAEISCIDESDCGKGALFICGS